MNKFYEALISSINKTILTNNLFIYYEKYYVNLEVNHLFNKLEKFAIYNNLLILT